MATARHLQGIPVWHEIVTPDPAGSRRFYTGLLDWQEQRVPMGAAGEYLLFTLAGRPIGGLDADSLPPGAPAHWATYFSVEDPAATVAANAAGGGQTLAAPALVPGVGSFAVCRDPQGAIWYPFRGEQAPTLPGEIADGDFIWSELLSPAAADAAAFYAGCLGYGIETMDMGALGLYRVLKVGEAGIAGVMPMPPDAAGPAHWLPYLRSSAIDDAAARAQALGATLHLPPTDIGGVGRIAVLADPQGATIALFRPDQR